MKSDNYIANINIDDDFRIKNLDNVYKIISNIADAKVSEMEISDEEKKQLIESLKIAYLRRKAKLLFEKKIDIEFNKTVNHFVEYIQKINNLQSDESKFIYFSNHKEYKQYERY